MKRCKVGDLAFIISSDWPENIGRIVRVVKPAEDMDVDWTIESQGAPLFGITRFRIEMSNMIADCSDRMLLPIRPEPELIPAPPQTVAA